MSKAEKFIQDYTRNCSNEHVEVKCKSKEKVIFSYEPWLTPDQAKKAVEIAREETINEVCEWIKDNIEQYPVDNWDRFVNSLITDLKRAMKDE